MDSDTNQKLLQAQQGIARMNKIDSMLRDLQMERSQLGSKITELVAVWDKENNDVLKIEGKSLTSLFYSMLGKLEERVEKEQQEALAAKLKYDQALKDLDDIQFQIEKLSTERKDYVNCQQEFDTLFAAKKEQLMKDGGECAHNILEQSKKLNDMKINLKEVKEAISVGSQAVESLERVRDSLNSAEDWGTWDLLGGDVFTDIEKHSHIDDAQSEMENVQTLLRQFHSELTDIHIDSDICIETGGFAKFADFFFDGLIADWNMQSKINQSQANVDNVSDQVSSAVKELELMEDRTTCGIKNLEKEIDRLVVDS